MHRRTTALVVLTAALISTVVLTSGIVNAQDPQGGPRTVSGALTYGFVYQGQLKNNGSPVTASCEFRFSVWDAAAGGGQASGVVVQTLSVADGLFTSSPILVDSGTFNGAARYLQIGVKCPGETSTTYLPRQELTPAPYALYAVKGPFWSSGGNGGTTANNFIGTTDNVSLTLRANNVVGWRLAPSGTDTPNVIGGYSGNWVAPGVVGAAVGGGGASGFLNRVTDNYGIVSGGYGNRAGDDAGTTGDTLYATVGGGVLNVADGLAATVGGGAGNRAGGPDAVVAGGDGNSATGEYATIAGGRLNIALAEGATIGGGYSNYSNGINAAVGGGRDNSANGYYATVGGGAHNSVDANYATVPGGYYNDASQPYTLAAGRRAHADNQGAFVWADSNDFDFTAGASNQFRARSTGGVQFVLAINASGTPTYSCSASNGNPWACSSDRNVKENVVQADARTILDRLAQVPIYHWNAIGVDPSNQHLGPMAQDFYAAFQLGIDDKAISTIDLDGVALASIQALHREAQEKDAEIAALKAETTAQRDKLAALEARLDALDLTAGARPSAAANGMDNAWLIGGLLIAAVWVSRFHRGGRP